MTDYLTYVYLLRFLKILKILDFIAKKHFSPKVIKNRG